MNHRSGQGSAEVSRLRGIQQEVLSLLEEAEVIITRHAPTMVAVKAKAYWLPEARFALVERHGRLVNHTCCMDDTIEEMLGKADDDNEDEYSDTDDSED